MGVFVYKKGLTVQIDHLVMQSTIVLVKGIKMNDERLMLERFVHNKHQAGNEYSECNGDQVFHQRSFNFFKHLKL